jgi:uncharacterized membrane protein YphA (DoxX/SURF4 family)
VNGPGGEHAGGPGREVAGGAGGRPPARAARVLADPRLTFALRVLAGVLLVYASHAKLFDPQPFADAVDDYRILPLALVDFTAIVLPWIEFVTGICLLLGLATAGAGLVTAAMAVVFTGALASALARGLEIGCGCFAGASSTVSWHDLWLRLVLLAFGIQIARRGNLVDWPASLLRPSSRGRRARGRGTSV